MLFVAGSTNSTLVNPSGNSSLISDFFGVFAICVLLLAVISIIVNCIYMIRLENDQLSMTGRVYNVLEPQEGTFYGQELIELEAVSLHENEQHGSENEESSLGSSDS
eukprot:Nk52_evm10s349 gene=Nk52_evmTU10s349